MTPAQITALDALIAAVEAGVRGNGLNTASVFGDYQSSMDAVDAFDGSLDAARALHDALLPDHKWMIELHSVLVMSTTAEPSYGDGGCDPARSWLLAILRAIKSQVRHD